MVRNIQKQPQIIIKMFSKVPHSVCASVRLSPEGHAVGYFITETERPGFVMKPGLTLYNQVMATCDQLDVVTTPVNFDPTVWLVFQLAFHTPHRHSYYYSIPFDPDSKDINFLGSEILQFLTIARKSAI